MHSLFKNFCHLSGESLIHTESLDDGTNVAIIQLMYHVALYVNPESVSADMDYDDRFCYHSLEAALKGIELFKVSGHWLFWQKHHNKQISNVGGYLYGPGSGIHMPKYAIGMAGWSAEDVRKGVYRYYYYECSDDRERIWVHCSDGSTVGRFSKAGIDIHTSIEEQLAGAEQCLICTHEQTRQPDFEEFVRQARQLWYIDIPIDLITFAA